ncbi:YgiQ family radical SAM protein [Psychrobacter urativorans]|uniref:YgiQ family radical SAM protein n=1 Tax=Psychrobacter urativorans TaxID=45610 RepID=A0A0M4U7B2_9GAMM|nr:YgiQ family radical SAM protein [Psychrobacter urativorans]ALF60026.1 YgiQ family radical SAM protein [Psychrobacter urativorans]
MSADTIARTAFKQGTTPLYDYDKHWASCYEPAPYLPMSRKEMDDLGWDACDVIIISGDAYVDHPSFGMAIIGRLLEAQGFRVGIIAQPDWKSKDAFMELGKPVYAYGVTAGNMDSMINRYTADRKIRSDDAYSPGNVADKRPDRAAIVYSQRCREAYPDVPIILGGIEGSLRRIAHYDYWSDKVRRSILLDARADVLLYGNAERAIVDVVHGLSKGYTLEQMSSLRGTCYLLTPSRRHWQAGMVEVVSNDVDTVGRVDPIINPYVMTEDVDSCSIEQDKTTISPLQNSMSSQYPGFVSEPVTNKVINADQVDEDTQVVQMRGFDRTENDKPKTALKHKLKLPPREKTVIRLPDYEHVKSDPVLYAHANRILHLETNPGNARALVQRHSSGAGNSFTSIDVWLNPPPIPLSTEEMDYVFDLPYARLPHPSYGDARIPAYDMIKFSVNIMRGCFGGCTFCSITEHEGRIIQNRSEESILREVEAIRDTAPSFTGVISDLGGPTANMYRLSCKDETIEKNCRKPSCVYPDVCENLITDHSNLTKLYRKARDIKGVKKILIASGLRYDLAVKDPEYVKELVTHHVGGYLKIAPEHSEEAVLSKMMKPGMGSYDKFKAMFEQFSQEAGKEQYLIPYFIAAHPGTKDEDMMNLALWLKSYGYRADQVQAFYPSPMATATTMYHTHKDPLHKVSREGGDMDIVKSGKQRKLHKAFLRYHDPKNWALLREALKAMGRSDLIGKNRGCLIPPFNASLEGRDGAQDSYQSARKKNSRLGNDSVKRNNNSATAPKNTAGRNAKKVSKGNFQTQHTGLPPRKTK